MRLLVWLGFTGFGVYACSPAVSEKCVVLSLQVLLRVRCGSVAANPAAIFDEDNVSGAKKVPHCI